MVTMENIQVFVEYKVIEEKKDEYLRKIRDLELVMNKIGAKDFQVFEGADQPHLFVEMFQVAKMESYYKLKRKRCQEEAEEGVFWQAINNCVEGGKEKIHMWAFLPVKGREE